MEANRRCGTSCGATTAKATGRCWSAWPGKAASRHPRPRTWRVWTGSARARLQHGLGFEERPRGQDRHAARRIWPTSPSTRWIWTPARWWRPSCTRPIDTTTLSKTLAKAEANLEAVGTDVGGPGRMRRRQRLSLTGGLEGSERQSLPGSRRPSRPAFRAGTVMRRRGARSPTTVRGSSPGSPVRPSSCAPRSSSAALPTTSSWRHATNLAARARECAQAIPAPCSTSPATIFVTDAPAHRRRHPAGGRGGRIWRYFRSAHAHRGHAGGTGGLAKRPDGFRRRIPPLGVRAGKSHLINGLLCPPHRRLAGEPDSPCRL